jgi:hypothetical protein
MKGTMRVLPNTYLGSCSALAKVGCEKGIVNPKKLMSDAQKSL